MAAPAGDRDPVGRRLGSLEVVAEIGSGGMALVYRAVQRDLGRTVALKRLRDDLVVSPEMLERFSREARSVAALQHENIVGIYDLLDDDGVPAMVLEWVEGVDLHDLLVRADGPLPADVAAIIGLKIAAALEYAHYRKVVHRDIKPSNVMVSRKGEVKLTDFGIAKDLAQDDLTRTGLALGTPSYMSPEQVVGAKLDFKSDLFSFGILLYQMLTGRKPFVEDEAATVLEKIRDDDYVPARRHNPDVPRDLDRILRRCLQKRPERRFVATTHLRRALEAYLARHVAGNHSGRLVAFLHHQGLVDAGEAALFVEREVLEDDEMRRVDLGGPPTPPLWPFASLAAGALMATFLWITAVHAGLAGPTTPAAADVVAGRGTLKVVALPWARVSVDGVYIDTTPFAREIPLSAGRHRVRLENDSLGAEEREVDVPAHGRAVLEVRLGP